MQAPGDKKGGKTHILHFIFHIYDYSVKCIAIQPDILYLFATKQAPGDKKGGKTHILQPRQILCENCASNTLVGFLLLLFFVICKGYGGKSDTITFKDLFETCQHFLAKAI